MGPKALTFADACQNKAYAKKIENDAQRHDIAERFEELQRLVTGVKHDLQAQLDIAGIGVTTFTDALKTTSTRHAMQLAL